MMQQGLAPRVEHAEKAECGAEVVRRPGDLEERRRTRVEEEVVDDSLVLQGQAGEDVRDGKDDVGVPDRQQLAFPLGAPLIARVRQALWTVPITTRVVRDGAMAAGGTAIEMSTQRGSSTAFDRPQHTKVLRGQPGAMGGDEARAVTTDDVSHLAGWPGHRLYSRRVRRTVSAPETGIASSGLATAWRCRCDKCR
jgi:hypothetical protein